MNKTILLTHSAAILGSSLLGACSKHTNPLLTADKVKAARFIEEASQYAVKQGQFKGFMNSENYYKCYHNIAALDNPFQKTNSHQCIKFFDFMVRYAKSTKAFNSVTVSDLRDAKVIPRLNQYIQKFDNHNTSKQAMAAEEKVLLNQEK